MTFARPRLRTSVSATVTAAILVTALTGCSSPAQPSPHSPTSRATEAPSTSDAGRRSPACLPGELRAALEQGLGFGRGEFHLAVLLTKSGAGWCTVSGSPRVRLARSASTPIGESSTSIRDAVPPTITLHGDVAARAEIVVDDVSDQVSASCDAKAVGGAVIQLGGSDETLWAPFPEPVFASVPTRACADGGTAITVRPLMPSN